MLFHTAGGHVGLKDAVITDAVNMWGGVTILRGLRAPTVLWGGRDFLF